MMKRLIDRLNSSEKKEVKNFVIKNSWKKEKADRIDREEKINNIYNEIMGKNEKEVENEK